MIQYNLLYTVYIYVSIYERKYHEQIYPITWKALWTSLVFILEQK
jgi:hypothetical protein